MNKSEQLKLMHDITNSIVVVKNMARSASLFVRKTSEWQLSNNHSINHRQVELFKQSMEAIQKEAKNLEQLFTKCFKNSTM